MIKPQATSAENQGYKRTNTTKIAAFIVRNTGVDHPQRCSRDILTGSEIKSCPVLLEDIDDAKFHQLRVPIRRTLDPRPLGRRCAVHSTYSYYDDAEAAHRTGRTPSGRAVECRCLRIFHSRLRCSCRDLRTCRTANHRRWDRRWLRLGSWSTRQMRWLKVFRKQRERRRNCWLAKE